MDNLPLVSVCVITYNSSRFVIETLDSIYSQSYPEIELIISDDCSTDDTIEKIQQWLSQFGHKFTKASLITAEKNTGITANCTRALQQAHGEWVKSIAGDDILYPNAIESFVSFVTERKAENISLVVSSIKVFKEDQDNLLYIWPNFKISSNIHEQLKRHIVGSYIKSPGVFIRRETLNQLGGFNPHYPMLEDDPLWIKFLTNGHKFYFNTDILVGYRIHSNAISNGGIIPKKHFLPSLRAFKKELAFPLMKKEHLYLNYIIQKWEYKLYDKLVEREKIGLLSKLQLRILHYLNRSFLSAGFVLY